MNINRNQLAKYQIYINNLHDDVLRYAGDARIERLEIRRKEDCWFRIKKFANGWGIPINEDGIIILLYDDEEEKGGKVIFIWDLKAKCENDINVQDLDQELNLDFRSIGFFDEGHHFQIRLFG